MIIARATCSICKTITSCGIRQQQDTDPDQLVNITACRKCWPEHYTACAQAQKDAWLTGSSAPNIDPLNDPVNW